MKSFAVAASLCALAPVTAFVPSVNPMTAVRTGSSNLAMAAASQDRSIAIPFDPYPEGLDGSMVGDVGFDPAGFARDPPSWATYGQGGSLRWYREAELAHGRVAMLATLGWIFPELYHFPGNADVGYERFAETNPLLAYNNIPGAGGLQIVLFILALETIRLNRSIRNPDGPPGDIGLGQGEGRWNPFGFDYSEEEYKEKQLQELKHGRTAMVGIAGMYAQTLVGGEGIISQIREQFALPEAVGKAGYFFPEGL